MFILYGNSPVVFQLRVYGYSCPESVRYLKLRGYVYIYERTSLVQRMHLVGALRC